MFALPPLEVISVGLDQSWHHI